MSDGFFTNKSVAIIGSAPHLKEFRQAEKINSFDLVVRFNTALPLDGEIKYMTGNRCDVLYMNVMKSYILNSKELKQIKLLKVNPDFYTDDKFYTELKQYENRIGKNKIKAINKQYTSGLVNFLDGTFPNTGLSAMCEILDQLPKKVYLTGFTFWQKGGHYPGYRNSEFSRIVEELKGDHEIHRQLPQIKYFMKYIYSCVEVDPILKSLCENEFKSFLL